MAEGREHKRIYFGSGTELVGSFHPVNEPENTFYGRILNLSRGGLFVSIRHERKMFLQSNDLLVMNEIKSNDIINMTTNILLEVRWTHDQGMVDYLGCGCQFIEVAENGLEQVEKLLEWGELMANS